MCSEMGCVRDLGEPVYLLRRTNLSNVIGGLQTGPGKVVWPRWPELTLRALGALGHVCMTLGWPCMYDPETAQGSPCGPSSNYGITLFAYSKRATTGRAAKLAGVDGIPTGPSAKHRSRWRLAILLRCSESQAADVFVDDSARVRLQAMEHSPK